jgi:hypothetical protein
VRADAGKHAGDASLPCGVEGLRVARPRRSVVRGQAIDGRLASWQDLAGEQSWGDLLVGNGLSSHIWPGFGYAPLYARACEDGILVGSDRALFTASATENFESVLGAVAVSIRTLQALGDPAAERLRTRYLRIQATLGMAVRAVHMPLSVLPAGTRALLRRTLRDYQCVFTTSYDLLLYWCAGHGAGFDGFTDFFFCNGRLQFDPAKTTVDPGVTRLLYLHGALHLLIDADGVIRKRRSRGASLLAQFGHQHETETLTRPLLVAEGLAHEKARIIYDNAYLSFALEQPRRSRRALVFGLSLRDEDAHIVNALNHCPRRSIAVAMRAHPPRQIRHRQARVRQLLDTDRLYFFDASTHPVTRPSHHDAAHARRPDRARSAPGDTKRRPRNG